MAITKQTARKSSKGKSASSSAVADTADQREIKPLPPPKLKQGFLPGWPKVTLPTDGVTPNPVKEARAIKIFFVQQLDALKDAFLTELELRDERQDKREMDLEELRTVVEEALEETVEELTTNITESVEETIERQGEEATEEIIDAIEELETQLVDKIKVALADNTKAMQGWFTGFLESKGGALLAQDSVTDPCEQPNAPGQQPTAATTNTIDQFRLLFPQPAAATTSSIDEFKRLFPLPEHKSGSTARQPSSAKDATRLDAVADVTATAGQDEDRHLSLDTTQRTPRQSIEIAKLVQSKEQLTHANKKLVDANNDLAGANAALALANDKLVDANAALALTNHKLSHTNGALALANEQLISSNKDLAMRNSKLEKTNEDLVRENAKLVKEVEALRGQRDAVEGFKERIKRVDKRFTTDSKQVEAVYKNAEDFKSLLMRLRARKLQETALLQQVEGPQGGSAEGTEGIEEAQALRVAVRRVALAEAVKAAAVDKTDIGFPPQRVPRVAVAGQIEWEKLESPGGSEESGS